jgi:glutamate racemase
MIGVFDSGLGGLTVLRALVERFPQERFLYLGDQAHVPYGNRPSEQVVDLTRAAIEQLFRAGCGLVILGCNTATAVAARTLQQQWLPGSEWTGRNILGIVAPTVEAATQTAWAVTTPQYPQKYNTDLIVVFGTTRTITSNVYVEEIGKRCPKVTVVQQICAELAGAIEDAAPPAALDALVKAGVDAALAQTGGTPPHFPLVEAMFRKHLPSFTRILSQPEIVADSLEDYLARHRRYASLEGTAPGVRLLTTGNLAHVDATAHIFWPEAPRFEAA